MRQVLADAHYWVAIINDQDQSHAAAKAISLTLQGAMIFTTEEALTEVLAFFSERGQHLRQLTDTSGSDSRGDQPWVRRGILTGDRGILLSQCAPRPLR